MERPRTPHFLRVVQALTFVSDVGPVAIIAGSVLLGCGSPPEFHGVLCPQDASCFADDASDGSVPFDGFVAGVTPIDSGAYDGQVMGIGINPDGGGIHFGPDASHEAGLVGGPLIAPELPT